jgi:hypothetical protein
MGLDGGTFCEFGAWDGQRYSNTFALLKRGWSGIYIEGDKKKYEALRKNTSGMQAKTICCWVAITGPDTLDQIIARATGDKKPTIHVLSIDIDSDDLAVWKSIKSFRPWIVVIEYNPTIPTDIAYVNPAGQNKGNSCRAISDFARSIDYDLVALTDTNMILVDRARRPESIDAIDICDLTLNVGHRYFFGYDGTLIVAQCGSTGEPRISEIMRVPWKRAWFVQPVPRMFRRFDRPILDWGLTLFSSLRLILGHPLAVVLLLSNVVGKASKRNST